MKKSLYIFLTLVGLSVSANAQNVVIQQNSVTPAEQASDPNLFYINGIPSTLDIGGVDVEIMWDRNRDGYGVYANTIKFKNFRDFPVSVLYSITIGSGKPRTGTIVLDAKGTKTVNNGNWAFSYEGETSVAVIVRKLE